MSRLLRLAVIVSLFAMLVGLGNAQSLADFVEQQTLSARVTADGNWYGVDVSLDGNIAIIGSTGSDCLDGENCGAAYILKYDGNLWEQVSKLTASDALAFDWFGNAVAVSGDMAVVGARFAACASGDSCGAAYVFKFDGAFWVEQQKLVASDAQWNHDFGMSIALSGDTLVVGAPGDDCIRGSSCGAVYVFHFNGTSWVEEQKLTDSSAGGLASFGQAVSLDGDTLLVGAPTDDFVGFVSGSAFVYRFDGSTWVEEQKLFDLNAAEFDRFGGAVSLSGNTAMVGAPHVDCLAGTHCGAAFVYRFNGKSWVNEQKMVSVGTTLHDSFGLKLAVSGDLAVAWAYGGDGTGMPSGSVYIFSLDGSSWIELQKLSNPDTTQESVFGGSVSLDGTTVLVGMSSYDCTAEINNNCGSAFVFNCIDAQSPLMVATGSDDKTKDRYLSFNPSTNPGRATALRVTRAGSSTPWYVSCILQDAGADGMLGDLVKFPEFCEWTDSVIHIRGCEVVPGNEYMVDATSCGVTYSTPVSIFTTLPQVDANRSYGDLVGAFENGAWKAAEGIVTANDIVAVVQKFQLHASAPHISRIDNDGQTPNGIVAGNDILREVLAFSGSDFGYGVTGCLSGTCVPNCP